jgi:hypothetical protein
MTIRGKILVIGGILISLNTKRAIGKLGELIYALYGTCKMRRFALEDKGKKPHKHLTKRSSA